MNTIARNLATARKLRKRTQKEVEEATAIRQSTLSKAEHGLAALSEADTKSLADLYGLPVSFFHTELDTPYVSDYYFRRRLSIADKDIDALIAKTVVVNTIIETLLESVDIPQWQITNDEIDPVEAARQLRYKLRVPHGPMPDMGVLLEKNGILVFPMDFGTDKIDGLSSITGRNHIVMYVNRRQPADRLRFTMAHELGHILLHLGRVSDNAEDEADAFASELLLPVDELRDALANIDTAGLGRLKRIWRVSIHSLLRKAKDTGAIDYNRYRNMQIYMSKCGYAKREPIPIEPDKPSMVRDIINLYKTDLDYSEEELLELMNIGKQDYKELFCMPRVIKVV